MACAFGSTAADEHAEQHAGDVGVEDGGALAEGEAEHGAGRVLADPFERQQRLVVGRQLAAVAGDRFPGDRMKPPRADVVAERPPRLGDVVFGRGGKRLEGRVFAQPLGVLGQRRGRPASAAASLPRRGCGTGRGSAATADRARSCDTSRAAGAGIAAGRADREGCPGFWPAAACRVWDRASTGC